MTDTDTDMLPPDQSSIPTHCIDCGAPLSQEEKDIGVDVCLNCKSEKER